VRVVNATATTTDETYGLVTGKAVPYAITSMRCVLRRKAAAPTRTLVIEARAYDDELPFAISFLSSRR